MSEISDEMLMAYADGELPEADLLRVRAYLATSAEGARRLNAFTRTGRDLGLLYDQPMHEAIPTRLLDAVRGPAALSKPERTVRATPAASLASSLIGMLFPQATRWSAATATASFLAIGAISGWALHGIKTEVPATTSIATLVDGALLTSNDFSRALDVTPGGQTNSVGGGSAKASVKPVLTFQSLAGTYCRQYELAATTGAQFVGVGCRLKSGQWQIEVHAPVAVAPSVPSGGYVPASGRSSPTVEGAIDRMIKGDVLSHATEKALIENQWRPQP